MNAAAPINSAMRQPIFVTFFASSRSAWRIDRNDCVVGDSLPSANFLDIRESVGLPEPSSAVWQLSGVTSHARYTNNDEASALNRVQERLGRQDATRAALIPIRKTQGWWALAQDERRAIFEKQSRHIAIGMEYLPPVARRLHHCRELGEPFDFLTWFEYAPEHSDAFEELVKRLRQTNEWQYVDREIDIRLSRDVSLGSKQGE
jgi:chlorite dismutase